MPKQVPLSGIKPPDGSQVPKDSHRGGTKSKDSHRGAKDSHRGAAPDKQSPDKKSAGSAGGKPTSPKKSKSTPLAPIAETPPSGQAQGKKDVGAAAPKLPAAKQARSKKEPEYYPDDLLNKGPISPRLIEHLAKKCGPPIQENCVNVRIDSKRPPGRLEETMPSRHERVPPATVVLMFNCFQSGFQLEYGDLSTVPEAEAVEIRSIRSHAVLGLAHISPNKNAPLEERIVFKVGLTASCIPPSSISA